MIVSSCGVPNPDERRIRSFQCQSQLIFILDINSVYRSKLDFDHETMQNISCYRLNKFVYFSHCSTNRQTKALELSGAKTIQLIVGPRDFDILFI